MPGLPQKKGQKVSLRLEAGGVQIELLIEYIRDTRRVKDWDSEHFITYHMAFKSVQKIPVTIKGTGRTWMKSIPNPISQSGYRSHWLFVGDDTRRIDSAGKPVGEALDLETYLHSLIRDLVDEGETEWIRSRQMSLF